MTNFMLITQQALLAGLINEIDYTAIITGQKSLDLHTFSAWKDLGYNVKKGEKAVLKAVVWKYKKSNHVDENEEIKSEDDNYYKQVAYFFSFNQVEKIKQTQKMDIRAYNKMLAEQRKAKKVK